MDIPPGVILEDKAVAKVGRTKFSFSRMRSRYAHPFLSSFPDHASLRGLWQLLCTSAQDFEDLIPHIVLPVAHAVVHIIPIFSAPIHALSTPNFLHNHFIYSLRV